MPGIGDGTREGYFDDINKLESIASLSVIGRTRVIVRVVKATVMSVASTNAYLEVAPVFTTAAGTLDVEALNLINGTLYLHTTSNATTPPPYATSINVKNGLNVNGGNL
jgi:hypothetical protein